MSAVHASQGPLTPASPHLRSEVDIVCSMAIATLGADHVVPWAALRDDYSRIRQRIGRVVPGCEAYEAKVDQPGGFVLPHPPRDSRTFETDVRKAKFTVSPTDVLHVPEGRLLLQTMRSHDQFNTTIYGLDDRYRGVKGGRRVVFVHPDDIRGARSRRRPGRRPGQRVGRRRAAGPRVPRRGLRAAARLRRGVLPGDQPPDRPRPRRRGQQLSLLEVGGGAAGRAGTIGPMTNPERDPDEMVLDPCSATDAVEVLTAREVPLGGLRAMRVRRTLPQRHRSLIGAWCFVDHYGPDHVADTGGMSVAPHPHTGLQTVSWLFTGEVEHHDSAGHRALVRPGEVNLMTAGRGISHSEVSTPATDVLHGAQLWVALPETSRDADPGFEHHAPDPVAGDGWEARVFLGTLLGTTSPVATHTPLLGAELLLDAGTVLDLDVDEAFEHGVLVDTGIVEVCGQEAATADLAYVAPGRTSLRLTAVGEPARLLVLGGPPFGESIVMWWNFVGRSHEDVVAFREEWQRQVEQGDNGRFGVVDNPMPRIPAPELPHARLKERR